MKKKRIKAVIVAGSTVLICCVIAAGIKAGKRMEESERPINVPIATHAAGTNLPIAISEDDKGFWLTIRPTGFETKEMTLDAGDYFVVIQNATGRDRFALKIQRDGGQTIHEVRLPRFRKYWKHMVTLTAGRYLVSEIDHPEWNCVITVN
jgi:hypothetical protein